CWCERAARPDVNGVNQEWALDLCDPVRRGIGQINRLICIQPLRVPSKHAPVGIDLFDTVVSVVEVFHGGRRWRSGSGRERLLETPAEGIVLEANGAAPLDERFTSSRLWQA